MELDSPDDLNVLTEIISSLKKLSKDDQQRTLQAVATFLNLSFQGSASSIGGASNYSGSSASVPGRPIFSEDRDVSPKDFLREKAPLTDVERVTCLAYYLTHYRNTPQFKTLDISTLNTEAAQPKFSNASVAFENSVKAGLLVQAAKGSKQISSMGEVYVQHLPDRDAAKSGIQKVRQRKKPRKPPIKSPLSTQS